MIQGLDLSVYQQPTPSLTGYDFVIARACYGTHPDATFAGHIAAAKAAGLVTGAYCFGRTSENPLAQATALLNLAGDVDFLVLDVEADGSDPEMTEAQCSQFLAHCRADGQRQVWLYHSRSGFPPDAYGFDGRWVADYGMNTGEPGRPPAIPWDIWQYTSNPLDKNLFDGTRADLLARLGRTDMAVPAGPWFDIDTSTTGEVATVKAGAKVYDYPWADDSHLRRTTAAQEPWLTVGWKFANGINWLCRIGADGASEFVAEADLDSPPAPTAPAVKPTRLGPGVYEFV